MPNILVCIYTQTKTLFILLLLTGYALLSVVLLLIVIVQFSAFVPIGNIPIIDRFLNTVSKQEEYVSLSCNESGFHIYTKNSHLYSRVIDTDFPDYKKIIPDSFTSDISILKNDLLSFFKKARFFVANDNKTVDVSVKDSSMILRAFNSDIGETIDTIPVDINGSEFKNTFNYEFIYHALSSINDERVLFRFAGVDKPLVISGYDSKNFTALIMPSVVQSE